MKGNTKTSPGCTANHLKVVFLTVILWILTGIAVLSSAICFPRYFCIFPAMIALLLVPVIPWQKAIKQLFGDRKVKPVLLIILSIAFAVFLVRDESFIREQISSVVNSFNKIFSFETTNDTDSVLPETEPTGTLEIHFFDVGQADSALVMCNDKTMLIDGGNADDSSFLYSYLKQHGLNYLDYIVCSHPHEDHIGGLSGALNYAKAGLAYCSMGDYGTKVFNSFMKYLDKQNVPLCIPAVGDSFALGSATVTFLGPVNLVESDINNNSLVMRIQFGKVSVLFTGDAETIEEDDIIRTGATLKSTILKVGHHGSSSSSSQAFIDRVSPSIAVISVGKDNMYGHPDQTVIDRLQNAGADIYRTDVNGEIILVTDGDSISIQTEK